MSSNEPVRQVRGCLSSYDTKSFDKAHAAAKAKRKIRLQKDIERAKLHVPEPRASLLGAGFHESYDEPYKKTFVKRRRMNIE